MVNYLSGAAVVTGLCLGRFRGNRTRNKIMFTLTIQLKDAMAVARIAALVELLNDGESEDIAPSQVALALDWTIEAFNAHLETLFSASPEYLNEYNLLPHGLRMTADAIEDYQKRSENL